MSCRQKLASFGCDLWACSTVTTLIQGLVLLAVTTACHGSPPEPKRFEVAAWVDHFDFYRHFDTEKSKGLAAILDHVQQTGATTILWRNCGGANMRYQSKVESHHHDSRIDKRRVSDIRQIGGWVRYGEAEPDIVATVVRMCRQRGLKPGIHWPYEETHWSGWTIGGWNLEHPQYWGRTATGQPWWGRSSIAYEPVIQHKLQLVDELLDRGIEVLFLDFWRTGGWSPSYEFVPPIVDAFRQEHRAEPPKSSRDLVWCRHVSKYITAYLRRLRQHMKASHPHVELAVGIPGIAPIDETPLFDRAADWQAWVAQGLIDTLVINYVCWDRKDPLPSTRAAYREVLDSVDGRCRVLCPIQQYDYSTYGLPAYQKATDKSNEELAGVLMRLAWEEGADGVSLECVDYNNYRPKTRDTLRDLGTAACRQVRQKR